MNSKPSNQYFGFPYFSSSLCFLPDFFSKNSAVALILALGSVKFPPSYTSIWFRELNLAQKRSSSVNLMLLVPSLEPFFHSNWATSNPVAMSQTIRFFSPCTNFSHVMIKESRGEKLRALIVLGFRISLSSLPETQSTTWRPMVGSAITARRPENGANFPRDAVGYDGKPGSTTNCGLASAEVPLPSYIL